MSVYVISDLHGCKKEFDAMLEKIQFNDDYDQLWINGDICDRGKEPIPLLQEIISRPSMHVIFGNHDVWLARYSQLLIDGKKDSSRLYYRDLSNDCITWLYYNGGLITSDQFMDLSYPECYDIKNYLDHPIYYQKIEVKGKKFLLMHAGLGNYAKPDVILSEVPVHELIWSHIGLDDNPFDDVTMIVGHMPTFLYGKEYEGKIAHGKKKSILHIDCGCVFGRTLGCVRLDDMQEFYVPSSYPKIS